MTSAPIPPAGVTLSDLETILAALDTSKGEPYRLIIHPQVYWRIRFARFGSPKERAMLSAHVPHRMRGQGKRREWPKFRRPKSWKPGKQS